VKHRFRMSKKNVQTMPGADTDSEHNLLVAKIRKRLKKIKNLQKGQTTKGSGEVICLRQKVHNTLDEKLSAT